MDAKQEGLAAERIVVKHYSCLGLLVAMILTAIHHWRVF
jgi:hypothetical protein